MSVKVSNWVWEHSQAKGTQRLVLLAIADHCQDNGHGAYPSIESLAKKCQMSSRAVQENLRRLVELGELELKLQGHWSGTNLYAVLMGGAESAGGADRRHKSAGGGVQNAVANLHPNYKEPLVEPSRTKTNTRALEEFNTLWKSYPSDAKGKKPEKQLALKQWIKLSPKDRERALVGAKHYAQAHPDGAYVKHAWRWLRDRTFEAWQTPARAGPNGKAASESSDTVNAMWGER